MLDAPLLLLLLTAREGRLRLNSTVCLTRYGTHALRAAYGAAAGVCANNKTGALSTRKTGETAGILFRR
jgi:hypothetical protein